MKGKKSFNAILNGITIVIGPNQFTVGDRERQRRRVRKSERLREMKREKWLRKKSANYRFCSCAARNVYIKGGQIIYNYLYCTDWCIIMIFVCLYRHANSIAYTCFYGSSDLQLYSPPPSMKADQFSIQITYGVMIFCVQHDKLICNWYFFLSFFVFVICNFYPCFLGGSSKPTRT